MKGALFENWFIAEKIKERTYSLRSSDIHFWRNRLGSEVDFVELMNSSKEIVAHECKWKEAVATPTSFTTYPQARFKCITTENIVEHFGKCGAVER